MGIKTCGVMISAGCPTLGNGTLPGHLLYHTAFVSLMIRGLGLKQLVRLRLLAVCQALVCRQMQTPGCGHRWVFGTCVCAKVFSLAMYGGRGSGHAGCGAGISLVV
jgi:hypothetical protein